MIFVRYYTSRLKISIQTCDQKGVVLFLFKFDKLYAYSHRLFIEIKTAALTMLEENMTI